jgi:hypothetical protein
MDKKELLHIIKEDQNIALFKNKLQLSEGVFDSIMSFIIDKIVRTKYKDYFDAVHNDPEFKAAQADLQNIVDRIQDRAKRYEIEKKKWESDYKAAEKKFGKQAAQKMLGKKFTSYASFR